MSYLHKQAARAEADRQRLHVKGYREVPTKRQETGAWSPVSQNADGVWTLHGEPCGSREEGEATYAASLEAIRLAALR